MPLPDLALHLLRFGTPGEGASQDVKEQPTRGHG